MEVQQLLINVPNAMKMLSVSRSRIYRLINSHDLTAVKIGQSRLILASSIRELVERLASQQGGAR